MKRAGLLIDLSSLELGNHDFSLEPSADDLDLDTRFSDITVNAVVSITGSQVIIQIDASATVALVCDRTLVPFDSEVAGSSVVVGKSEADDDGDQFDDVVTISADQIVDISGVVRDTLLLAVPTRAVAPGADEEEIKTVFSDDNDNEAIDPRWEGLKKLRNRDDQPSSGTEVPGNDNG